MAPGTLTSDSFELAIAMLRNKLSGLAYEVGMVCHHSVGIPELNPLLWLHNNPNPHQCYFQSKDQNLCFSGSGEAICLDSSSLDDLPVVFERASDLLKGVRSTLSRPRFFVGLGFQNTRSQSWKGFPSLKLCLPQVFVQKHQGQHVMGFNLFAESKTRWNEAVNEILNQLSSMQFEHQYIVHSHEVVNRTNGFDYSYWKAMVNESLANIASAELEKVVLARQVSLTLADEVQVPSLLYKWQNQSPDCYSFLMTHHGRSFIGCSPERLFSKRKQKLETEAIAGTQPRGKNREQDFYFEQELMTNEKLRHEHGLVTEFIAQKLLPLCADIDNSYEPYVLKLKRIQHLGQRLQAELLPTTNVSQVIAALHPTPAVCGQPREGARKFIQQYEPAPRGWYAGAVGYLSEHSAEFAVAIRSALCKGKQLKCFSGVGIVEGSDPLDEWRELESKIQNFLSLLHS